MNAGVKTIAAGVLDVGYLDDGAPDGWAVVLSPGSRTTCTPTTRWSRFSPAGAPASSGPTSAGSGRPGFRSASVMRSGQQAALGSDVMALVTALNLEPVILAGYDWGGLASCVATALWPDRVAGLVSLASYDIIDIGTERHAAPPAVKHAVWYQHLFQTERGHQGLSLYRRELGRMLWQQWSPGWQFDDATFDQTAGSFDNPDFVEVVIHAYRHAFGLTPGDPAYAALEDRLANRPKITVPAVAETLDGVRDPLKPGGTAGQAGMFLGRHEHPVVGAEAGHNLPQEAPEAFADAVLTVRGWLP